MKKLKTICLVVFVLTLVYATAIALAGSNQATVKDLICQRTDALSGFYAGELTKEEASERIKAMEAGTLLSDDLRNMELYFATDIEQVRDYKITDVIITEAVEDIICADVTIKWKSEGLLGIEQMVCTYKVICQREENGYKLVQFF